MQESAENNAVDTQPDIDPEEAQLTPKGWKNPPTVADLKKDLEMARSSHDAQEAKITEWLDHLNITGSAVVKTADGSSKVQPKLIRKQAEWRYAALSEPFLNTDDLFKLSPVTWEDAEASRQNALVLNNQINTKIDKVEFIDEYVRTAVDEGTVIVRVGWEFEEDWVDVETPIVEYRANPALAPLFQELDKMQAEDPTRYKFDVPEELKMAHEKGKEVQYPLEPVIKGMMITREMKTIKNQPVLEICDYRNLIVDPSCKGNADKARFAILSFETSMSELRESGKYENLDQVNITTNSVLSQPDHATDDDTDYNFSDDPRKRIIAYEYWGYWDYDGSGIAKPFVATWVGQTLIRLEENPFPDKKIPFVFVSLLPKRKSVYGEPDGELLIDNQKIIGAVTRGMIDIMGKSANGQTGYRKDALDATNKRKFQMGKDYEYNGGVDPRLAFHMHTFPEIPASAQFMLQQQNFDAESMTGVKVFGQGINGDALGESVGNGRSVMDAASKRETGILRRLAKGMVKIGRKIIAMNQEFLEEEEIVRITNDEFVPIRRDDLAGNFDLRLDISTLEEDNAKAQELAFMLQTIGPNGDQGMTNLILRDICRLRKMPELAHQIENYQPQPDPVAQQIQQLELQKLQKEIALLDAKAGESQSDAMLNQSKAIEAQAKAGEIKATADLKNLDFLETESGVKQEREKELVGEQARSNLQRDLVNHDLKMEQDTNKELVKYKAKNKSEK